ncbi:hypothetical protein [Nocardiopsis composta]|uniref:Uncharacterized protein n=1 Tax=Nocardiopsis composta TaxID=157465 RepID=A0A7W8QQH9_9ACTN|nr:hypothetical protein [Nocardiopsis composta]MBB5434722.1 hypothetical protein [Nocardiopsis composta]
MEPVYDPTLPAAAAAELARSPERLLPADADLDAPVRAEPHRRVLRGLAELCAAVFSAFMFAVLAAAFPEPFDLLGLLVLVGAVLLCARLWGTRGGLLCAALILSAGASPVVFAGWSLSEVLQTLPIALLAGAGLVSAVRRFAGIDPDRPEFRHHGRYLLPLDFPAEDRELIARLQRAAHRAAAGGPALAGTGFSAERSADLLHRAAWEAAVALRAARSGAPGADGVREGTGRLADLVDGYADKVGAAAGARTRSDAGDRADRLLDEALEAERRITAALS